jgi:hypothetical protein
MPGYSRLKGYAMEGSAKLQEKKTSRPRGQTLDDTDSDALARLEQAIQRMEAAGEGDPKLGVLLNYLRSRGWEERGCIMFSQYLDTVLWVAGHLAQAFPKQVGACGPAGWRKSC